MVENKKQQTKPKRETASKIIIPKKTLPKSSYDIKNSIRFKNYRKRLELRKEANLNALRKEIQRNADLRREIEQMHNQFRILKNML